MILRDDLVVIKQEYVKNTLKNLPRDSFGTTTLQALQLFRNSNAIVADTGITEDGQPFIRLIPSSADNPNYHSGNGVTLVFPSLTILNNTFEQAHAFIKDTRSTRAYNTSGEIISKGDIVSFVIFSKDKRSPTIKLSTAKSLNTARVLGIAEEEILPNRYGSILISGSYQGLDTSAFKINDTVYLSDTPGKISVRPGVVSVAVGVATHIHRDSGSIVLSGMQPPLSEIGPQGVPGSTGIQGIPGSTGLALGSTGIRGVEGPLGPPGIPGATGIRGLGSTGIRGLVGERGARGPAGPTGLALGSTGLSGPKGVPGATGIGFDHFEILELQKQKNSVRHVFPKGILTNSSRIEIRSFVSRPANGIDIVLGNKNIYSYLPNNGNLGELRITISRTEKVWTLFICLYGLGNPDPRMIQVPTPTKKEILVITAGMDGLIHHSSMEIFRK